MQSLIYLDCCRDEAVNGSLLSIDFSVILLSHTFADCRNGLNDFHRSERPTNLFSGIK